MYNAWVLWKNEKVSRNCFKNFIDDENVIFEKIVDPEKQIYVINFLKEEIKTPLDVIRYLVDSGFQGDKNWHVSKFLSDKKEGSKLNDCIKFKDGRVGWTDFKKYPASKGIAISIILETDDPDSLSPYWYPHWCYKMDLWTWSEPVDSQYNDSSNNQYEFINKNKRIVDILMNYPEKAIQYDIEGRDIVRAIFVPEPDDEKPTASAYAKNLQKGLDELFKKRNINWENDWPNFLRYYMASAILVSTVEKQLSIKGIQNYMRPYKFPNWGDDKVVNKDNMKYCLSICDMLITYGNHIEAKELLNEMKNLF